MGSILLYVKRLYECKSKLGYLCVPLYMTIVLVNPTTDALIEWFLWGHRDM